ncbi:MAG: radical SAM family heme chaperone HemW [Clostridia bacterium]|nr:radical SAM family heme chaperone HemW [Clostridia bacterium]
MATKTLKNFQRNTAIYVHFPFCKQRCKYCTFLSCCNYNLADSYFDALCKELVQNARKDVVITSIFFGGGTPSSVDAKHLQMVFDAIYNNYSVAPNCEVTVECNPESVTQQKVDLFVKNGVNRVSIGLQSANDNTLKAIGRLHNYQQFLDAVNLFVNAGLTNINADLIIGLPESATDFENTLNKVVNLPLTHLSVYALEVYPNSQLDQEIKQGKLAVNQDADYLANLYDVALEKLSKHGYNRYEVSNFAKQGKECRHNLAYWRCQSYFGFGASAHGYMDGIRTENASDISQYVNLINTQGSAVVDSNLIDVAEQMDEYVMLGLRLQRGISVTEFYNRFNCNLEDVYPNVGKLIYLKMLQKREDYFTKEDYISVRPDKFYVLNEILTEIL